MAFVGRDKELRILAGAIAAARDGRGSVVVVSGEAGIGKTALATEAARRAKDMIAIRGVVPEAEHRAPLYAWREAMEALADAVGPGKLTRALGHHAAALATLVPALRERLSDPDSARPLDPTEQRVRLFSAVQRALAVAPIVCVLEDVHWADEGSLRLLDYIAERSDGLRACLIVTTREVRATKNARSVELSGLTRQEARALAEQEGAGADVDRLLADTRGNPFFLTQALTSDRDPPPAVREVVGRRLAALAADVRTVLRAASVLSRPFALEAISKLAGVDALAVIDRTRGWLVEQTPGRFAFVHAIVRRAVLDDLSAGERATSSREAARIVSDPAERAELYLASRALPGAEEGVPWCLAAAEQAEKSGALEAARTFLRAALELQPTPELRGRLALADARALDFAAAEGVTDVPAELLAEVARAMKEGGAEPHRWRPLAARAFALLGDRRDEVWARLTLACEAFDVIAEGPIYVARPRGLDLQALAIARASTDEATYAATLVPHAWRTPDETRAIRTKALLDPRAKLRALDTVARDLLHRACAYKEAQAALEEMAWVAERFGAIAARAEAYYGLTKCRAILGDLSGGRAYAAKVPELVEQLGAEHRMRVMGRVALNLELDYLGGGDWKRTAAAAVRFCTSPAALTSPLGLVSASFAALAFALAGDGTQARRYLGHVVPILERVDPRTYQHQGALEIAITTMWTLRDATFAARALSLLASAPKDAGAAPIGCTELQRARVHALRGAHYRARTDFAAAREVLEQRGFLGAVAIADADEASMDGDEERAAAAQATFVRLGMTPWIEAQTELTAREREVLALLAEGLSSKALAARLFLSVATVNRHIANIYEKLGVDKRASAVRWAMERGLHKNT